MTIMADFIPFGAMLYANKFGSLSLSLAIVSLFFFSVYIRVHTMYCIMYMHMIYVEWKELRKHLSDLL